MKRGQREIRKLQEKAGNKIITWFEITGHGQSYSHPRLLAAGRTGMSRLQKICFIRSIAGKQ